VIDSLYIVIDSPYIVIDSPYIVIDSLYIVIDSLYIVIDSPYIVIDSLYIVIDMLTACKARVHGWAIKVQVQVTSSSTSRHWWLYKRRGGHTAALRWLHHRVETTVSCGTALILCRLWGRLAQ